ncbi:dicarboxylate/amino acid:cation symporter [Clostridiaceae bacterium 68-1-5]|uniref:Dicarboxylate/amino acid:cation symporter n=1 Tax=Suipraeoptans intestinalis TaxID=2606628 RepID=A0A6N7UTY6_9FIRM|nr:dicarboxylate/amino acid:cation symporter [Suipraeoptans intestinalis]MSR94744.1 dicarboxylate/amino acid:cation symporter [Suipraeoptans intestinalis]
MKKKLSLTTQIFIALVLGILAGIALTGHPDIATTYINPIGTIFLNLIKWIVTPLVFFSIMAGVISLQDIKKVGSIGGKTILYYMCTTAFAVTIGLAFANGLKGIFPVLSTSDLKYEGSDPVSFMETLVNMFPSNFIAPFLDAAMLQVIIGSLLVGFAIMQVGDKGKKAVQAVDTINDICLMVMELILKLSPIGVFCLLCPVVAVNGPSIIGSLAKVLLVAYVCYVVHGVFVYSLSVKAVAGMNPVTFFKGMLPAILFAFSSASSVGTLPLNMECTEKLGAKKEVSSFVLPLGATINMDGTAIYQGVCVVFIASCYGINLTISQMITIVLTATLASIGTAGVPGSGMVMLAMVLQSVGLPVEGIALVAGVDRLFDMGRTTVNITGDASCAIVVNALLEKKEAKRQ